MAEGIWGKVQTHRRDKVLLLGRGEEEGWASIENSLCPIVHACLPTRRGWRVPSVPPHPGPEVTCHPLCSGHPHLPCGNPLANPLHSGHPHPPRRKLLTGLP